MWILYVTIWLGTQPVSTQKFDEFRTQRACQAEAFKMQKAVNQSPRQGRGVATVYTCEKE